MERLSLVKTTVQSVQVRHSSADKTMILFVVVSKMVIGNTEVPRHHCSSP